MTFNKIAFFLIIFCQFILINHPTLYAQELNSKGSKEIVLQNDAFVNQNKTFALIVGVSEYKNIRSLQFADADAKYFTDFLFNYGALNIEKENLILLTNENAKQGDILSSFQLILENINDGDNFVFYFSGHGDVEEVDEETPQGYLLAHDSPINNYPLGGTISISMLDSVFNKLIERDCNLTIIIDACKSGQLAGGLSGKSYTSKNLNNRWKKVISVLSAQPNQLSYESEKWGGGRGVFSYYLIKGLSGYADMNNDFIIYLNELEQYIGMNISNDTDYNQQPVVEGPNKFSNLISYGDSSLMVKYGTQLPKNDSDIVVARSKTNSLSGDSECQQLQLTFFNHIDNEIDYKKFEDVRLIWNEIKNCVDTISDIKYDYMRFLINEINEMVLLSISGKKLLKDVDYEFGLRLISELQQLTTPDDFFGYSHFENLKVYLQALAYIHINSDKLFDAEITFELHTEKPLSKQSVDQLIQTIKKDYHIPKNLEVASHVITWNNYYNLNNEFVNKLREAIDSEYYLYACFNLDTVLIESSAIKGMQKQPKHVMQFMSFYDGHLIRHLEDGLTREPNAAYLKYAKAMIQSDEKDIKLIKELVQSAIEDSPTWLLPKYLLADLYENEKKYDEAIQIYEEILTLDSTYQNFECIDCFYLSLAELYVSAERFKDAEVLLEKWKYRLGNSDDFWYWLKGAYITSFNTNKKRNLAFWERLLWKETDFSLSKQFDLMNYEFATNNNRKNRKVMLQTFDFLIELIAYGEYEDYFGNEYINNRNVALVTNKDVSTLLNKYFPNGREIYISDSVRRHLEYEILIQLDETLLLSESLFTNVDYDRLVLKTLLINYTHSHYIDFLETLLETIKYYNLVETWDKQITFYNDPHSLTYAIFESHLLESFDGDFQPVEIYRFFVEDNGQFDYLNERTNQMSNYYKTKEKQLVQEIKKEIEHIRAIKKVDESEND